MSVVPTRGGSDTRVSQAVASQDGGGLCRVLLLGLLVLLALRLEPVWVTVFRCAGLVRAGADA
ncbi:MAG: hypothetical protein QW096_12740 [Thermofilaceae archaeon]